MSKTGFQLIRLALMGSNVPVAEALFTQGLNVVTGPSDTGKTFILQCIDYMLGGSNTPKDIPETEGYDTAILEIKRNADGQVFTLKRSIKKAGKFTLSSDGDEDRILKQKHDGANDDNLSYFLLENMGLTGKEIRKNVRDEKLSLSFRYLAHLCIISEEEVIREISPVLTGHYTTATAEKSVFALLLSGIDDSELTEIEDPKISKARINAKIEMLNELIGQTREQIEQQQIDSTLPALKEQLTRLELAYKDACEHLTLAETSISEVEQERQNTWKRLREIESRLNVLAELSKRFELLNSQYESDLHRLDAIIEASQRVEQMTLERCPVCGSPAKCHDKEHQAAQVDPAIVAQSCLAETNRIRTLINDLKKTRSDVNAESETLSSESAEKQKRLEAIAQKIREHFRPKVLEALERTREIQKQQEDIRAVAELFARVTEFEKLIQTLYSTKTNMPQAAGEQDKTIREIDALCAEIEQRLKSWNCPGMDRVSFNYDSKTWDIIISGRERSSHGKGVRALTHAAFTLALLRYCVNKKMPHPGFVVIDSPLVVYREPDSDEDNYSRDVKNSFFNDTASTFAEEQVIILENEEPPKQINEQTPINIIKFTKSHNTGRCGFIPASEEGSS